MEAFLGSTIYLCKSPSISTIPLPWLCLWLCPAAAAATALQMQIHRLSSIRRLLRHTKLATSAAPMHRLSSPWRTLFPLNSAAPRWWPAALAQGVSPHMASPDPPFRRAARSAHASASMATSSGVKGDEFRKLDRLLPNSYSLGEHAATTQDMKYVETTKGIPQKFIAHHGDGHGEEDERITRMDIIFGKEDPCRTTSEFIDDKHLWGRILGTTGYEEDKKRATEDYSGRGEIMVSDDKEHVSRAEEIICYPSDGVAPQSILPNSSHRDGSIYRGPHAWKKDFCIADRNETWLEAMMLSEPMDCIIHDGTCVQHSPLDMFQIFSVKLGKIPKDVGSVELYGYIAVRDDLDQLRNYAVNISRDDPIIVEQGSFINMSGPKRGINLMSSILIEYDMRIKTGEQEKEDLQLIDGATVVNDIYSPSCYPCTNRIYGDCGAIDITASRLDYAVEATIEVLISEVQSSFNLCLGSFSSGLHEEIRLFDGVIAEPRGLKRYAVAVVMDTWMDLKFKQSAGSSGPAEYCCSFKANNHGHAIHEIKTDFALISVKVTWSALPESSHDLPKVGLSGNTLSQLSI